LLERLAKWSFELWLRFWRSITHQSRRVKCGETKLLLNALISSTVQRMLNESEIESTGTPAALSTL
jgi:hypothetical protein